MNAKELVETIDNSFRFKGKHGAEVVVIGIMEWERIRHKVLNE